jgi:membrane protease YdiL (CAAX protease family)
MRKRSELAVYFALAFGVAWAGVLVVAAARTGFPAPPTTRGSDRLLVFLAMLAGPSSAALALAALGGGLSGLRDLAAQLGHWRIGARWWALVLVAPGLLALTLGSLSLASPAFAPPILRGAPLRPAITVALVAGLGAGLLEELGWTGSATPRLLERLPWPRAGLLLGLLWAVWHLAADYWGGAPYGPLWGLHFVEWVAALTPYRLLMTWAYSRTRSLLLGALLHASFTGSQALLWPAVPPGRELLWYGLFAAGLWAAATVLLGAARPSAGAGPALSGPDARG